MTTQSAVWMLVSLTGS